MPPVLMVTVPVPNELSTTLLAGLSLWATVVPHNHKIPPETDKLPVKPDRLASRMNMAPEPDLTKSLDPTIWPPKLRVWIVPLTAMTLKLVGAFKVIVGAPKLIPLVPAE